jgi:hypothetical protein
MLKQNKQSSTGIFRTTDICLVNLIDSKWKEYNLDYDDIVPPDTIRSRNKRQHFNPNSRGVSPILPPEIEEIYHSSFNQDGQNASTTVCWGNNRFCKFSDTK